MQTVYVGMGLTQAPQEFKEKFQTELKNALRQLPNVEVMDFIGLTEGTAVDVYEHDRLSTEKADLCLFVVDYPSIGLGIEISLRLETKKPMLIAAKRGAIITRMLIGLCEKHEIQLLRYDSVADIVKAAEETLSEPFGA